MLNSENVVPGCLLKIGLGSTCIVFVVTRFKTSFDNDIKIYGIFSSGRVGDGIIWRSIDQIICE